MPSEAPDTPIDAIHRQVMWDRLIAVVEEQAQTILRTAFGSVVREAGDLSGGVYDLRGRMIAQAVTGTPGHVNTMARAVEHFLARFPVESMRPGEVFVTNDPWLGTGHLFDFVVVSPACLDGKPVALLASTCHVIDVGGRGFSAEAKSIFEEGVRIPHMRLRGEGTLNEDLMTILLANTRNPVEVRGDLLSLVSCNDTGAERLRDMMAEFGLKTIEPLADHVIESSRDAMRKAVRAVPNGRYRTEMELDGYDEPVFIKAEMQVFDEEIVIDYAGTSRASAYGINSPLCYTEAYTCFGLKCIVAPEVPNNHGSLSAFRTVAEPGSAVHPVHPSPVTARHVIGQMLPDVAFGCLAQTLPGRIPAESAGSIWVLPFADAGADAAGGGGGGGAGPGGNASRFNVMNVGMGGTGARPGKDGLSVTAFPSGVGAIPVEVTECESPLVFWRKEFLPDSGGAGAIRGGLGQVIEVGNTEEHPFTVSAATFDRMRNPPRGRDGGRPGRSGTARLASGARFDDKAVHTVPAGDRLIVELPGGGGLGDPRHRSPDLIRADLEAGYVSPEGAKRDYEYEQGPRVAVDDGHAHICSVAIDRSAAPAMSFLADPEKLSSWAVGMGETTVHPGGAIEGAFPGTGAPIWARIDADPGRGTIHCHLGPDPDSLVPRIMVRVVPGSVLGRDPESCVVSLVAWRQEAMDDARWEGLKSGHEREILDLKRLIESTVRP